MTDEPPRMYQHALKLYNQLQANSEDGIFEGSLVAAFRAIEVSQSYYSTLYGVLKEMGCIEVLYSGRGGGAMSRVELHHAPELDKFVETYQSRLTNDTPHARLTRRIETIEGRLPNIDLHSYISETERRLEALESREG